MNGWWIYDNRERYPEDHTVIYKPSANRLFDSIVYRSWGWGSIFAPNCIEIDMNELFEHAAAEVGYYKSPEGMRQGEIVLALGNALERVIAYARHPESSVLLKIDEYDHIPSHSGFNGQSVFVGEKYYYYEDGKWVLFLREEKNDSNAGS